MRSVEINGADFRTVEEIHEQLANALDFPDYYGKNLDALYDVLTETDLPTQIVIDLAPGEEEIKRYLERMVDVISDATMENENLELLILEDA